MNNSEALFFYIFHGEIVMKEGDFRMKVERMTEIETPFIKVGDRIHVDHYTATCQEITPKGALFLLDQYLDKAYQMNPANTNEGG